MDKNTRDGMASSKNEHWCTPSIVLDPLYANWGKITLDPCSNPGSIIVADKICCGPSIDTDGLKASWQTGGLVYINPPYGRKIKAWVIKLYQEAAYAKVHNTGTEFILLAPARTDSKFFQDIVYPSADQILLWKKRIVFNGATAGAFFPSFLGYWGHRPELFDAVYQSKGLLIK